MTVKRKREHTILPTKRTKCGHRTCKFENCPKRPYFGQPGSRPEFCKLHAPTEFVDVQNTRCKYNDCTKRPSFGISGSHSVEFCKLHAPTGYVNVKKSPCLHDKCTKHPSFGVPGSHPQFCKAHAPSGYVDVVTRRCQHGRRPAECTEDSCGLRPSSRKCIACCSKVVNRISGDPTSHLCISCRVEYGHSMTRVKKAELQLCEWFDQSGYIYTMSNKKLSCAPTTRYPDFVFIPTTLDHVVILECDEHEHASYEMRCEVARISELIDSVNGLNLHLIRYNPHCRGLRQDKKRDLVISALKDSLGTNLARYNDTGCIVQYIGYSEDRVAALDDLTCKLQHYQ